MGVEIKVVGLTKSFGKQLIWGDVTLSIPAGPHGVTSGVPTDDAEAFRA